MARTVEGPPDLRLLQRELALLRTRLADAARDDGAAIAALGKDLEALHAVLRRRIAECAEGSPEAPSAPPAPTA